MRILRVISSMKPETGGPCQGIRNSIPALEKMGVQNEIVSFDKPDEEFISKDNFIIHALGPSRGPYAYCSKLNRWLHLNLKRFDAVIVHGLWLYNSYGTFYALQQYKKRHLQGPQLFVMPHGMLDPYFQRAKSRKLKAIRNYFFWKFIEHRVINNADGLLFTCEQELFLAREPFSPYKPKTEINVGYGIVHPPQFENKHRQEFYAKCPGVIGKPFFLFLSRIHPKKGVDLLIKAYSRLKEENPGIPDLVIAGPGLETAFGESLQSSSSSESIHFPGMLMDSAKWGAFYSCEAFVLPSHQENFGIAVVEALACKKAVLISDQVNIFREIQNMGGGIVAEDSEVGTYNLLREWIDLSQGEQKQMQENAFRVFSSHYTMTEAAKGLITAIKENLSAPIAETK